MTKRRTMPRPEELMTTTEVMWALHYRSLRAAAGWCRRHGVQAQSRAPGVSGESQYLRSDFEAAQDRATRQGRGYRKDLVCHRCGQGRPHGKVVHRQNPGQLPPVWACEAHDTREVLGGGY